MDSSEHLLRLADDWSIWRTYALRGAGFPAELPLRLATPGTAQAADAWMAQTDAVNEALARAIKALEHALGDGRVDGARALSKALKLVRAGGAPLPAPGLPAAVDDLARAVARRAALAEELAAAATAEHAGTAAQLRAVARDDRFREAVTWQNLALLAGALDPYLQTEGATDKKARQREQLIASYIQRYCLKNESIGFFGPIGWGRFLPEGPTIALEPGSTVTFPLSIYLESWGVEALARLLAALPGIKPWIPPRRSPLIRVEGRAVHNPFGSFELPEQQARVLAACEGALSARDIAASLRADVAEDQVYAALAALEGQDLILWTFEIPALNQCYEDVLRKQIERIGDSELRASALGPLDELCRARAEVQAARSAREVASALAALDATFERLTGRPATRNAGQTYAGRTLTQCAARRNVDLALGPDVLGRIAAPLALLATSARWWSVEVARAYTVEVLATFRQLRAMRGTEHVEFIHLWPLISRLFPRAGGAEIPATVTAAMQDYKRRWAEILATAEQNPSRLVLRSADIKAAVRVAFDAPAPGWPAARSHSPDLMIAADSPEAIARGDYLWVMGETHFFINSIEQGKFFREHASPDELRRGFTLDQPSGRLTPAAFGSLANGSLSDHPRDAAVEHDWTLSWRPRSQVVAISELVVREIDGQLCIATRDDRRRWSLGAAINALFANLRGLPLDVVPDDDHMPRVTIDGLVVSREAWRFRVSDLAFVAEKAPLERFAVARAWARAHGIPRFCFYKSSAEMKPCYVDFDSLIYVEMLAKVARAADTITVTEMLPTPDQCWLLDREGNRYTCELRTVLIDDRTYPELPFER
jgi:hypothetical protein